MQTNQTILTEEEKAMFERLKNAGLYIEEEYLIDCAISVCQLAVNSLADIPIPPKLIEEENIDVRNFDCLIDETIHQIRAVETAIRLLKEVNKRLEKELDFYKEVNQYFNKGKPA